MLRKAPLKDYFVSTFMSEVFDRKTVSGRSKEWLKPQAPRHATYYC